MKQDNFFGLKKINFLLIGVSFLIVVLGFVLMTGVSSDGVYNPEIFASRYITIGPMISFVGFVFMIFAILYKSKK